MYFLYLRWKARHAVAVTVTDSLVMSKDSGFMAAVLARDKKRKKEKWQV